MEGSLSGTTTMVKYSQIPRRETPDSEPSLKEMKWRARMRVRGRVAIHSILSSICLRYFYMGS